MEDARKESPLYKTIKKNLHHITHEAHLPSLVHVHNWSPAPTADKTS